MSTSGSGLRTKDVFAPNEPRSTFAFFAAVSFLWPSLKFFEVLSFSVAIRSARDSEPHFPSPPLQGTFIMGQIWGDRAVENGDAGILENG